MTIVGRRYSLEASGIDTRACPAGDSRVNMAAPADSGALRTKLHLDRSVDISLEDAVAVAVGWIVSDGELVDPEDNADWCDTW